MIAVNGRMPSLKHGLLFLSLYHIGFEFSFHFYLLYQMDWTDHEKPV
jgi:hypothetical protein